MIEEDLPPVVADVLGSVRADGLEPDQHVIELSVAYAQGHLTPIEFVILVERHIQGRCHEY